VVPEVGLKEPPVQFRITDAPTTGLPPDVTVTVTMQDCGIVMLLGLDET